MMAATKRIGVQREPDGVDSQDAGGAERPAHFLTSAVRWDCRSPMGDHGLSATVEAATTVKVVEDSNSTGEPYRGSRLREKM